MQITVILKPGSVSIHPDPAFVDRNEFVMWTINVNLLSSERLKATVYFRGQSPFQRSTFSNEREPDKEGNAEIPVEGEPAKVPGDYKYGFKVEQKGRIVIDVDPWLIVK